jgi:cytosine/adenosine deaminase-related metal-dependent hydrolase
MWLINAEIAGTEGLQNIRIGEGEIKEVSSKMPTAIHSGTTILDCNNAIVFPGFINSHDHLDFNCFPPTANGLYQNYRQWGSDIHLQNKEMINEVLQIPKPLRIQWGLYKNLLNGITTVVNHGDKSKVPNALITVLQDSVSLHSVKFEKYWRLKLNDPRKTKQTYVIHAGEGTDEISHKEITTLLRWNFFKKSLFTVHAVAMDERQAKQVNAIIWCPASNYFLFNKTADLKKIKSKTTILFGTDSTLTAPPSIWEHLRKARETTMMSDMELLEALTKNPAKMWSQNTGAIEVNKDADFVVARKKDPNFFEAFFSINPEDILLVICKGEVRLFDEEISEQLFSKKRIPPHYSKIKPAGHSKYVYGDLPSLEKLIHKYYPSFSLSFQNKEREAAY